MLHREYVIFHRIKKYINKSPHLKKQFQSISDNQCPTIHLPSVTANKYPHGSLTTQTQHTITQSLTEHTPFNCTTFNHRAYLIFRVILNSQPEGMECTDGSNGMKS